MEAEKFREIWWSALQSSPSLEGEEWIRNSYQDVSPFWESLINLQKKLSHLPPKSVFKESYDFYHDCILRHTESSQAITAIDENGFIQHWNYKKVHRAVNFQVTSWSKNGVKPGQLIVILLPIGVPFFISLLAALRLGVFFCYLAPGTPYLSEAYLSSMIHALKPSWIITQKKSLNPSLDNYPKVLIESLQEEDQSHSPASYAYPAHQTIQYSLALHRQIPHCVVPLDAHTTYLHALRDGLLTLNLQSETLWASTLTCPLRTQPCHTLMAFLSGAAIFHIDEKALKESPSLLKNEKLHLLSLPSTLQRYLLSHPILMEKQLKAYTKSTTTSRTSPWKTFIKVNKLEETPGVDLLIDNSYGGSLFFSKPALDGQPHFLLPSPGFSWSLKDPQTHEISVLNSFGYLNPDLPPKENSQVATNFMIAQIDNHSFISSTLKPCIDGITLPIAKIEEVVSSLPFVENNLLYSAPKIGEIVSYQTTLIVFTNPLKNNVPAKIKEEWKHTINQQIIEKIGSAFVPDHIEFYPLSPRLKKDQLDRNWCTAQLTQGLLNKKRDSQLYQLISMLKKLSLGERLYESS
ncbi:MAG TPA: hypothetical protein PKW79_00640 [Rhabdochlamydiaceae bacterium]|nr:hypothetical protein [Rhabdochlamydiaceae bacterium]